MKNQMPTETYKLLPVSVTDSIENALPALASETARLTRLCSEAKAAFANMSECPTAENLTVLSTLACEIRDLAPLAMSTQKLHAACQSGHAVLTQQSQSERVRKQEAHVVDQEKKAQDRVDIEEATRIQRLLSKLPAAV